MEELLAPISGQRAAGVAQALLGRFGSLSRVVSAPVEQLNEVCGEEYTGAIIHAARVMVETALREDLIGSPIKSDDPALGRYLRSKFGDFRNERMHAVFLDTKRRYIADDNVGDGTHSDIVLQSRRLLARAFELGAVKIIIAHNHPSGECSPSRSDILATKKLKELFKSVDLQLEDHLICTKVSCFSMKLAGLL